MWHREGQKTRAPDTYRLAERAYRLFLAHFPADRDAYEMTYYTGELLWSLGRWREAAEIYTQVVAAKPDGKYAARRGPRGDAGLAERDLGWRASRRTTATATSRRARSPPTSRS